LDGETGGDNIDFVSRVL